MTAAYQTYWLTWRGIAIIKENLKNRRQKDITNNNIFLLLMAVNNHRYLDTFVMDEINTDSYDIRNTYQKDGCLVGLPGIASQKAFECSNRIMMLDSTELNALPCPWQQKIHLLFPWLYEIVCSDTILNTVEKLIGPDILCLSADLFIKPPNSDRCVAWHQDSYYWQFEENQTLTVWVALTRAVPNNGSMKYSIGSHKKRLPHTTGGDDQNMLTMGQELQVEVTPESIVETYLRPGEIAVHHGLLAHASGPNKTDRHRIGFAIRYIPADMPGIDGPRTTVSLVRGNDHYGHFEHERPPQSDLDDDAVRQHTYALEPHRKYKFATI